MNRSDDPDSDHPRPNDLVALIPNCLSLARLVLGLAFPWIAPDWRVAAVLAGAASDALDGIISRKLHATSTTGRILDPIADKVFVISVLFTLVFDDTFQLWQVILVGTRDLVVLAGAAIVTATHGWSATKRMPPSWLGKVTTAAQFVLLLSTLHFREVMPVVFIPTATLSVLAALDYLRLFRTRQDSPPKL
jgi:phosphatidylglycerophosphate synthase